jgi:hypothetical protein
MSKWQKPTLRVKRVPMPSATAEESAIYQKRRRGKKSPACGFSAESL